MSTANPSLYTLSSTFPESDWHTLSKFWHPVATSGEADDGPYSTVLLDTRVVVYRDSAGRAVSALDICPHRGAQLSRGEMIEGEIQCPYHGSRFDGTGKCTAIPAQDESLRIPDRMRLRVFETQERYGIVWARIANEELNPMPDWSVIGKDNISSAPVPPEVWDVTAARHAENFNDVSHLAFVHKGTFGAVPTKAPDYELEQTPGALRHHYFDMGNSQLFERHKVGADAQQSELIEDVKYDYRFAFPFASALHITAPDGRTSYIFDVIQPISIKKSRIFKIVARNFDLDGPFEGAVKFEQAVNEEDRTTIEPALPVHVPLDPRDECHIEGDIWSVAYRRALSKYGMGVDVDRVIPD